MFSYVAPEDLSKHWVFVEHGLTEVLRITKEDWTPVHIKEALNRGHASLHVCDEGFCILQKLPAPWTADPYLNVWVFWFERDAARGKLEQLVAWLDEVARHTKCGWWEWSSPREGWRWLERIGVAKKARTIWRREL